MQPPSVDESPIRRLHRHALESVVGFLTLPELPLSAQICSTWLGAAVLMKPLSAAVLIPSDTVPSMCASRLARHVGALTIVGPIDATSSSAPSVLSRITASLKHLHTMVVTLVIDSGSIVAFPSSLTQLDLTLSPQRECDLNSVRHTFNGILAVVAALPRLTRLTLVANRHPHQLSFAPLKSALVLEELSYAARPLDDSQLDDLRSLRQIRILRLNNPEHPRLHRLICGAADSASSPDLSSLPRWECLSSILLADAPRQTLIAMVPTLTELCIVPRGPITCLAHLPALRTLDLRLLSYDRPGAEVVTAVQHCSRLTALFVLGSRINGSHLAALLPSLPMLQSLKLSHSNEIDSTHAFTSGPVVSTLRSLELSMCSHAGLTDSEFRKLRCLKALTLLKVNGSFRGGLRASDVAFVRDALPQLSHCITTIH